MVLDRSSAAYQSIHVAHVAKATTSTEFLFKEGSLTISGLRALLLSFPPDAVKKDVFTESATHTTCGWKGGDPRLDWRDEHYSVDS